MFIVSYSIYYISQNNDYYPFGSLVPNRHGSSTAYRYGFQGQEKDDELKGEGNSYDFGARMLDPRVGRWFSVDSKAAKFSSETTYGYVSNNPLIFVDPDEKIIVIGGQDKAGGDGAKFINSGLRKLNQLIKKSGKEGITLVITDNDIPKGYKRQIERQMKLSDSKYKGKVSVVYINNGDELTNYMNSKSTKSEKLSNLRKGDPVTEADFFGHGYNAYNSSQPSLIGSFESGHGAPNEAMDALPSTRPVHNKWAWGKNNVDKLNPDAISNNGTFDFSGICNAATPGNDGVTSLASYTSDKLSIKTIGFFGRSDYKTIYGGTAELPVFNPHSKTNGIGPAIADPCAGQNWDDVESVKKEFDNRGKKETKSP